MKDEIVNIALEVVEKLTNSRGVIIEDNGNEMKFHTKLLKNKTITYTLDENTLSSYIALFVMNDRNRLN